MSHSDRGIQDELKYTGWVKNNPAWLKYPCKQEMDNYIACKLNIFHSKRRPIPYSSFDN